MLSVTCSPRPFAVLFLLFTSITIAGCGGGGSSGSAPVSGGSATDTTATSVIGVDCTRQRGYVPLPNLNSSLHGEVAVLDLSVDPDVQNRLLKIIDIGVVALPRSAAVDFKTGTVLVAADNGATTGTVVLIDESDDSLTTVPFPTGSRPAETSGVVVNTKGTALVSMEDATDCTSAAGGCTGQAVFNLGSRSFDPLILTLFGADSFAENASTGTSVGSADVITPQFLAIDVAGEQACVLEDINADQLGADPDGVAVDPTTNIWVVGNFQSPLATVINLKGATFDDGGSFSCFLNEGGSLPNSVNQDTGTGAIGMSGVAINSITHQAFLTAQGGSQIALLSLPTRAAAQLASSGVSGVNGAIPNDPNGNAFTPANFPYATTVDSCHNLGYVANANYSFLAQINLKTFKTSPSPINTALPAGSCAGVTTTFKCDNGNGVKFFPVSSTSSDSAQPASAQFSSAAFRAHLAAKQAGITRGHH